MENKNKNITPRFRKNAELVLKDLARGKAGENVVIISGIECREEAWLLAICAREMQMCPIVIDLSAYWQDIGGSGQGYRHNYMTNPLIKDLIVRSDICLSMAYHYNINYRKLLGSGIEHDMTMTGKDRRFLLTWPDMLTSDIDLEEAVRARERTLALLDILKTSRTMRITTPLGSDLDCAVGMDNFDGIYEVISIIPYFYEVAIIPKIGTVNGTLVVDGSTEPDIIRKRTEIDFEPLRITFKDSLVTGYSGHPVQVERLEKYIRESEPTANIVDEIGIVTTLFPENDQLIWPDKSHHTNSIHIAIGNNDNRKESIHAIRHVDHDTYNPVIEIDGTVIYKDFRFNDEYILGRKGKRGGAGE